MEEQHRARSQAQSQDFHSHDSIQLPHAQPSWQTSAQSSLSTPAAPSYPSAFGTSEAAPPHHQHQAQQHSAMYSQAQQIGYNSPFGIQAGAAYQYNGALPYHNNVHSNAVYSPHQVQGGGYYHHTGQQMSVHGGYRQPPYGWDPSAAYQAVMAGQTVPMPLMQTVHNGGTSAMPPYRQGARGSVSHSSGPSSASGSRSLHSSKPSGSSSRLQSFTFPYQQSLGNGTDGATNGSNPTGSPAVDSVPLQPGALTADSSGTPVQAAQVQKKREQGQPTRSLHQLAASSSRSHSSHPFVSHLPALCALPTRPILPPSLDFKGDKGKTSDGTGEAACVDVRQTQSDQEESAETASVPPEVSAYVASLHALLDAYERREGERALREEALGFGLSSVDLVDVNGIQGEQATATSRSTANAIVGLRLLQRVQSLQNENEELGEMLARRVGLDESGEQTLREARSVDPEVEKELQDAHGLITALSAALTSTKQRAAAAELALKAACEQTSRPVTEGMTSAGRTKVDSSNGGGRQPSPSLQQLLDHNRAAQRTDSTKMGSGSKSSVNGVRGSSSSPVSPNQPSAPSDFPALARISTGGPHSPSALTKSPAASVPSASPASSRPKNNPWGLAPR